MAKKISILLLGLALLAAVLYMGLWAAGSFLIVGDRIKQVDAVVILSGGRSERMRETARLIAEGYASEVIVTETGAEDFSSPVGSDLLRQEAQEFGLSPYAITPTEHTVSSTIEEARAVFHMMELRGMRDVIVVTDPYHTRRTQWIFREVFKGSGLGIRIHPTPDHWYRPNTWFFSLEGWETTVREYGKIILWMLGLAQ